MKLVIVTPYFYPKVGGLENYALEIAKGLLKKDWQVTIITSNHEGNGYVREQQNGIIIHRLPIQFKLSNTPVGLWWQQQIKELLKDIKPDVVNIHLPVPFIADMALRAARKLQIPVVTTYHNDLVKDSLLFSFISKMYYSLLGGKTLEMSSKIIATSAFYASNSPFLKKYQNKTEIVPPGVWFGKIKKKSPVKNQYILFVGQLDKSHRHKGLEYLIKAVSLLRTDFPDLQLLVAGKGNDLGFYQALIDECEVREKIQLLGFVSNYQLKEIYQNAVCICLPSTSDAEGFGMVVIEAASFQTPAIGSRIGGISESIIDSVTGLLVPPCDPNAIAQAVSKLLNNQKLRQKLGMNAYQRVKEKFTWEKQINKTDEVLKALV